MVFGLGFGVNRWMRHRQVHHFSQVIPGRDPRVYTQLAKDLRGLFYSVTSPLREPFVVKDKARANLIINTKNLISLEEARRKAAADQTNIASNTVPKWFRSYVGAKLEQEGKIVPVKVRLKGKGLDHYDTEKWSIRVKVADGYSFLGMKDFALTRPDSRAIFLYWLLNEALKREDVMHPKLPLIEFSINGASKGIYAIEEIPTSALMTSNQRKQGVILGFSDFESENTVGGSGKALNNAFFSTKVDFETPKDYLENQNQYSMVERAANIMQLFQEGKLKTSQVFKARALARYLALCDITNGWHGMSWGNLKFYYDPVASKLEPLHWDSYNLNSAIRGYEARAFRLDDVYNNDPGTVFFKMLFSDLEFMKIYMQELDRITKKEYLDEFFKGHRKEIKKYIAMARVDYPYHDYDDEMAFIYENQQRIRTKYLDIKDSLTLVISTVEHGVLKLNLKNSKLVPLKVESLSINGQLKLLPKTGADVLLGRPKDNELFSQVVPFDLPPKFNVKALNGDKIEILLRYRLLGTNTFIEQAFAYEDQKASKKL